MRRSLTFWEFFYLCRLRKQELASLAKSTEDALRAVEEAAKKAAANLSHSSPQKATEELPKPLSDRAKIIISIQDKSETKQYRVFAVHFYPIGYMANFHLLPMA